MCLLQVGAIIADITFGYVDKRMTFYLSAAFGLVGALVSWLFLPDTTGMSLDELDRWVKSRLYHTLYCFCIPQRPVLHTC